MVNFSKWIFLSVVRSSLTTHSKWCHLQTFCHTSRPVCFFQSTPNFIITFMFESCLCALQQVVFPLSSRQYKSCFVHHAVNWYMKEWKCVSVTLQNVQQIRFFFLFQNRLMTCESMRTFCKWLHVYLKFCSL